MTRVFTALFVLALVPGALAQRPPTASRCADCHFAQPNAPAQAHLWEWDRSPHGRQGVGCEACHGGDATTFEKFLAHKNLVPVAKIGSPVRRENLPKTCGTCHTGPYVSFQQSTHYKMLMEQDHRGPTCSTCHGMADGRLLSAKALESQCAACHGEGRRAPREARAADARAMYQSLSAVREQLKVAKSLIKRIDSAAKVEYEEMYRQAEVPAIEAVNAGHKFIYEDMRERLEVAQGRIEQLLNRLAMPRGLR
jgi:hypothetical protein